MAIIKPYTKKLLKDLKDVDRWESTYHAIRNKEHGFEILTSNLLFSGIWSTPVKFNLIEKFLILKAAKKVKDVFVFGEDRPVPAYFK